MRTVASILMMFSIGMSVLFWITDSAAAKNDYQPSIATAQVLLGGGWVPLTQYEEFQKMGCDYPRSKYLLLRATEQGAFTQEELTTLCDKVQKRAVLAK